jgi:predicted dehydrogenase
VKPLRIAVVGAGHLGKVHARVLSKLLGVRLVGVVDPEKRAREAVEREYGCAGFPDIGGVLRLIDAAVVAAPTSLHHAIGLDLLSRGIHVMMEKPLAATVGQAEELVQTAKRGGAVLQVGHVERFNPCLPPVMPYVRDAKYIEASRLGGFTGRNLDVGVVLDLMIHDIDLVLHLVRSSVREVHALGVSVLSGHEDVANARLVFESGCVANLNASRISPVAGRTMQIWSQEGFSQLDFGARQSHVILPKEEVLDRQLDLQSLSSPDRESLKTTWLSRYFDREDFCPAPTDQITAELTDFVESIGQRRPPRVTGEAGKAALEVGQRILAAIGRHAWDGPGSRRVGPRVGPLPHVIPGPHWHLRAEQPAHEDAGEESAS